jgi:L-asparaginase
MNPARDSLLILYTGGTIGMQMSAAGLAPASGFEERLRAEQAAHPERQLPAWRFRELSPPIDSANITQSHWLAMRDAIVTAVERDGCTGVLVLHGTDTLAYSAAALSFLLLGLPVPVLLTGSMLPAGVVGSDAWSNLFGALALLQQGTVAGVQVYFHGQALPGSRVVKRNSEAFDAFAEAMRGPQVAPSVSVPAALDYRVARHAVNLAVLPLFPGLRAEHLQALIDSGVQGLLLECYGSGTGPSDDQQVLAALREAHQRGVLLAAISQCTEGRVSFDTYAAGSQLLACGVISGGAMTREAALGKLFALLGAGLEQAESEHWFTRDLCGEKAQGHL